MKKPFSSTPFIVLWCFYAFCPLRSEAHHAPLPWAVPESSLENHDLYGGLVCPFAKDAPPAPLKEWNGLLPDVRNTATQHPAQWGALMVNSTTLVIGCGQNWFHPVFPKINYCGQPAGAIEQTIFWDHSRFNTPPRWHDLWDVVRYPGQRALYQGARPTLEIALLAANVPPAKIYRLLATPQGVDRAFRQLDRLRPYITWWRTPRMVQTLIQNHAILMGVGPFSAVLPHYHPTPSQAPTSNYIVQKGHVSLYDTQFWVIPSSLNDFTAQKIQKFLEDQPPHFPNIPTPLPNDSLRIDEAFWGAHQHELDERFEAWFTRPPSALSYTKVP